jgi:hypothetical protein
MIQQEIINVSQVSDFSNPSKLLLQKLLEMREEVIYRSSASDVREKGKYVYMISNGSNVLQIGKGKGKRMTKCMREGLAGKHNKAFICAIGELVLGQPNTYTYVVPKHNRVKDLEIMLHKCVGINTNQECATLIEGIECRSMLGTHQALWALAKDTARYKMLDSVEQEMAEELFELVTYATVKIQRTSRVVSSHHGDNLEGNILKKINKNYLSNVFMKLTDNYLRYGKHRMTNDEFSACKRQYYYEPYGKNFEVYG